MATDEPAKLAQLPDEMFSIIKAAASAGRGPRLGRLSLPGRKVIDTPHYLGITSRGVVPHLTQDTFARDASISGVYVALEDCTSPSLLLRLHSALLLTGGDAYREPPDGSSPLRRFVALPEQTVLVLGARRTPPVTAPSANPNTNETVSVCTAVGFKALHADDYVEAAEKLQADIVVGLGDVPYGRTLGSKRVEKATDRSIQWMQNHVSQRKDGAKTTRQAQLFAPLLPVSCANQQYYLDCLTDELAGEVSGLAVYDLLSLDDLPEALRHLPRLDFTTPSTPHEVLQRIALGLDVLSIPFITAATDAGIALDFTFPALTQTQVNGQHGEPLQLGIDMWSATHAVDLSPLAKGCKCYACANHHRAYIQHLLAAKEMLGWVLLQIHNHHTIDLFFCGIRKSIAGGSFEQDIKSFGRVYESTLPEKTGQGPRIRGYQFKSEGRGEPKKNEAPFTMLDEGKEVLAESALPNVNADAEDLEKHGFAEKEK